MWIILYRMGMNIAMRLHLYMVKMRAIRQAQSVPFLKHKPFMRLPTMMVQMKPVLTPET